MSLERVQIRQELARYILHSGAAGVWAGLVYGFIWILLLWGHVPTPWLTLWTLGFVLSVGVGILLIRSKIKYQGWSQPEQIERLMLGLMSLGAFYHCLSLLLFFPRIPALHQLICLVLMMALLPVMMLPLQGRRACFNVFWIPTLLVLAYLVNYQNMTEACLFAGLALSWLVTSYIQGRSYQILQEIFTRLVENEALVSELQQTNRMMRHSSETDGLTGLYNRSMFDQSLEKFWRQSSRSGSPLCLLMIDVDYFKAYNDHYGHLEGDQCLVKIAEVLEQSILREEDCAFRYGGEEFVVLLPNATKASGEKVAQRIRSRLEHRAIQHDLSQVSPWVSVSIGITAQIGNIDEPARLLIQQADEALYEVKRWGRNGQHCYSQST